MINAAVNDGWLWGNRMIHTVNVFVLVKYLLASWHGFCNFFAPAQFCLMCRFNSCYMWVLTVYHSIRNLKEVSANPHYGSVILYLKLYWAITERINYVNIQGIRHWMWLTQCNIMYYLVILVLFHNTWLYTCSVHCTILLEFCFSYFLITGGVFSCYIYFALIVTVICNFTIDSGITCIYYMYQSYTGLWVSRSRISCFQMSFLSLCNKTIDH